MCVLSGAIVTRFFNMPCVSSCSPNAFVRGGRAVLSACALSS
jgi:hypothetical protein